MEPQQHVFNTMAIKQNPAFIAEMKRQVEMAKDNPDLTEFLRVVQINLDYLVEMISRTIPYLDLTEQALMKSIAVNNHFINDWSMVAGDNIDHMGVSDEIHEGLEALSLLMAAREKMDEELDGE